MLRKLDVGAFPERDRGIAARLAGRVTGGSKAEISTATVSSPSCTEVMTASATAWIRPRPVSLSRLFQGGMSG
jgi:hypothetical protein